MKSETILLAFVIKPFAGECFTIFRLFILYTILFSKSEKRIFFKWFVFYQTFFFASVKCKKTLQVLGTSSRKLKTVDESIIKDLNENCKKTSSKLPYSPNFILLFQSKARVILKKTSSGLISQEQNNIFPPKRFYWKETQYFVSLKKAPKMGHRKTEKNGKLQPQRVKDLQAYKQLARRSDTGVCYCSFSDRWYY